MHYVFENQAAISENLLTMSLHLFQLLLLLIDHNHEYWIKEVVNIHCVPWLFVIFNLHFVLLEGQRGQKRGKRRYDLEKS